MIRKLFLTLFSFILAVAIVGGAAFWLQEDSVTQKLSITTEYILEVPSGSTPNALFSRLESEGLIQGAFWLRLHWRLNYQGKNLHVGEYRLTPGMDVKQVIDKWLRGDIVQYKVTLVEGHNIRQIRAALAANEHITQTLGDVSNAELMERLGKRGVHPEGQFFPDTYQFTKGQTDFELLKQAHQRLEKVLAQEWEQRADNLPLKTPYEALVLASIIEKETGVPSERSEIAGVFVRRLNKGMRLQTDPTVIYGMGERYQGRIRSADLKEATAYNTYLIQGLPPTPIAMVGREAIHAALHPKEGRSLFFVAKGDGSHYFSETLSEHNKAVREYQLRRRSDYRSSPASTE
ncbi:endolytic transglycosylase MltG [Pseudomonas sp. F1_0610]|uniref:endolytic transglycosylase MltG n=1 Tax=Pseudomonas sp. F1_0610 TaxID=3114284 RepID=UPI0039C4DDA7